MIKMQIARIALQIKHFAKIGSASCLFFETTTKVSRLLSALWGDACADVAGRKSFTCLPGADIWLRTLHIYVLGARMLNRKQQVLLFNTSKSA
jgi:hypothetical protein